MTCPRLEATGSIPRMTPVVFRMEDLLKGVLDLKPVDLSDQPVFAEPTDDTPNHVNRRKTTAPGDGRQEGVELLAYAVCRPEPPLSDFEPVALRLHPRRPHLSDNLVRRD